VQIQASLSRIVVPDKKLLALSSEFVVVVQHIAYAAVQIGHAFLESKLLLLLLQFVKFFFFNLGSSPIIINLW